MTINFFPYNFFLDKIIRLKIKGPFQVQEVFQKNTWYSLRYKKVMKLTTFS